MAYHLKGTKDAITDTDDEKEILEAHRNFAAARDLAEHIEMLGGTDDNG